MDRVPRLGSPQQVSSAPRQALVPAMVAGAGVVIAAFALASIRYPQLQPSASIAAYLLLWVGGLGGAVLLWRRDDRPALVLLIMVALLARAPLVHKAPFLSSDAYRYLWDGRVLLHGYDPYVVAPDDPRLHSLRLGWLYQYIDWNRVPSLYPPLALALFALADKLDDNGLLAIKSLVEIGDLAALALLIAALRRRGLPVGRAAFYAWSPVVIVEFAWSGHLESWALAALAAAVFLYDGGRRIWSAVALAAAVLVKLYPLALVPTFFARRGWKPAAVCAAIVALAYLPFFVWSTNVLGFLRSFSVAHHYNDTLHPYLHTRGSAVLLALCVAAAFYARYRGADLVRTIIMLVVAYLLVSSNVFPWYLTAFAILLPLVPDVFAGVQRPAMLGIAAWLSLAILGYAWQATYAAQFFEYAPLFAGLALTAFRMARSRPIATAVAAFILAGCSAGDREYRALAADEAAVAEGSAIYARHCALCHSPTRSSEVGPALDRVVERRSFADLSNHIATAVPGPDLSDEQRRSIVAYLVSLDERSHYK